MMNAGKLILLLVLTLSAPGIAAERNYFDLNPNSPDVLTHNDSGVVVALAGRSEIHAAALTDKEAAIALSVSDRIGAGDLIATAANSRVEIVSRDNILTLIGENAKVAVLGVRAWRDAEGTTINRLDLEVREGTVRVQVRENITHPELCLVDLGGVQAATTRGDFVVTGGSDWRLGVLGGSAVFRRHQGGVSVLNAGEAITGQDGMKLSAGEIDAIRRRYPFLYETRRAALPPTPPPDPFEDAP